MFLQLQKESIKFFPVSKALALKKDDQEDRGDLKSLLRKVLQQFMEEVHT